MIFLACCRSELLISCQCNIQVDDRLSAAHRSFFLTRKVINALFRNRIQWERFKLVAVAVETSETWAHWQEKIIDISRRFDI